MTKEELRKKIEIAVDLDDDLEPANNKIDRLVELFNKLLTCHQEYIKEKE